MAYYTWSDLYVTDQKELPFKWSLQNPSTEQVLCGKKGDKTEAIPLKPFHPYPHFHGTVKGNSEMIDTMPNGKIFKVSNFETKISPLVS